MFADAIEVVGGYTRPLFTIMKAYGGTEVIPAAGTLFFVNDKGAAVTSRHVAIMLKNAEEINRRYREFKQEKADLLAGGRDPSLIAELEVKYQYKAETIVQIRNTFVDCVDKFTGFRIHLHPKADLAIICFDGYGELRYKGHAVFKRDGKEVRQGDSLCRLGFAFPEFTNYTYDPEKDILQWTKGGKMNSPRFPMDGMVTRFLADKDGLNGIELSTPGLLGQSGGPLFDAMGVVCGMQSSTKHMYLGFDVIDKEMTIRGKKQLVTDYAFLHLGQCVHVDLIKSFLREHDVPFSEEPARFGIDATKGGARPLS
ncbi:MAG: trypsin-like peptidase domain-containing protein [Bacillota bacterium]|nr:trypsin-like peptidase domain-containing protein [Bacillota bacterium]